MSKLHVRRALRPTLLAGLLAFAGPTLTSAASPEEGEVSGRETKKPAGVSTPQSVRPAPAPRVKKAKTKAPDDGVDGILGRIRLDCDDPATCWFQEGDAPSTAPPNPLTAAELDGLLREILAGLEAHQDANIRQAEAESADRLRLEEQWFGSSDHHLHPSLSYYENPLKTLAERPALHLDKVSPGDFDIPIVLNERVQDWMVYFLTRGRSHFVRWLARAERYDPLLRKALADAGLPKDLVYQAMIESGFNPYATSSASAVGVWQFMPRTGTFYGLANDWWVDERRDPIRATDAAIRYLRYLYKLFGNWELACTAYNAGEGKVGKAIKMYGTNDFWDLSSDHRSYLKPESKHYVPKIMAAAILSKYVERYGLREEILEADRLSLWNHDIVQVPEATDLALVAQIVGVEVVELQNINPQLKRGFTPPGVENFPVNVPLGKGLGFAEAFAKVEKEERLTFVRHTVAKGQTLSEIADRYGVPTESLMKLNALKSANSLRVGTTLTVPVRAENLASRALVHVVAKGETLGGIAGKYSVSLTSLKDQNGLKGDTISVGQRLTVQTLGTSAPVAESSSGRTASKTSSGKTSEATKATSYTVRSGDTVSEIAERFGTSSSALRTANGLSSNTIRVGQRLSLPGSRNGSEAVASSKSETSKSETSKSETSKSETSKSETSKSETSKSTRSYTVQSGDVLGLVAERHGMSVSELQALNGISGTNIRVGQSLKVFGDADKTSAVAAASSGKKVNHVVASGEVLGTIAQKYGVSVGDVQRWNSLSGSTIKVGQTLAIHGAAATPQPRDDTHLVASGESLWSIAQQHGVSVNDLKSWNRLKGSSLRPGQKLTVRH